MNPTDPKPEVARWLVQKASLLIVLALLTGGLIAAAITGKVHADVHEVVASHLSAFLGAFWILGVAVSLPYVEMGGKGLFRLSRALVVAQYANWFITAVKAFLGVKGVDYTADATNNIVFGILNLFVVLPSLAAGIAWVLALHRKRASV